jgi:hypothetical protein
MHYRIVMPPHIGAYQILKQTLGWLKEEKSMQTDKVKAHKSLLLALEIPSSRRRSAPHHARSFAL